MADAFASGGVSQPPAKKHKRTCASFMAGGDTLHDFGIRCMKSGRSSAMVARRILLGPSVCCDYKGEELEKMVHLGHDNAPSDGPSDASRAFLAGREMSAIILRGRWAAESSARHYVQAGRQMLLALALPPSVAALAARVERVGHAALVAPDLADRLRAAAAR